MYINYHLLDMIRIKHTLPLINEKKKYNIEYTGQTCVQACVVHNCKHCKQPLEFQKIIITPRM